MANVFFQSKYLWEYQSREQGFSLLNEHFVNSLGQSVFQDVSPLTNEPTFGQPRTFYTDVYLLITQYRSADISFCRLFPLMWELNPHQRWINVLVEADLYSDLFLEKIPDTGKRDAEIEVIAGLLVQDAAKGILGANSNEYPLIRRAILPMERIQAVEDWRWGPLKSSLLHRLPNGYSACTLDFWKMLSSTEPENFFVRFLQDIFLDLPLETSEIRWRTIVQYYKSYANTVQKLVEQFLARDGFSLWLEEIARLDAGFAGVDDGLQWLSSLYEALSQRSFSKLSCYGHIEPKT
jgi:hypothetical protein